MTLTGPLIVQKYGGATLADSTLVKAAALRLRDQSRRGPLIAVVSAMGSTTNSLIDLARQVSRRPARRELDMLLSVGERISMSLVSMALNDLGVPAISFTGSQAGIFTDDDHFNARIVDIRGQRVEQALQAGKIVILAGFQGVSPTTKEITTLGRGGSDVTAVAMAAAFSASRCEILKEVPSVFTADPRTCSDARPLSMLSYEQMLDMTFWGAKVLHYRSVELARKREVPLYIGPVSDRDADGTLVGKGLGMYETHRPLSLNSHDCVLEIDLGGGEPQKCLADFETALTAREIAFPQILGWTSSNRLLVTGAKEILDAVREEFTGNEGAHIVGPALCSVTLTCTGSVSPDLIGRMLGLLRDQGLSCREIRTGSLSATVFLAQDNRLKALQVLHSLIP